MRQTSKTPRSSKRLRLLMLSLALVPCTLAGGCASWSSFREQHTPLTGRFWHRSTKQEPTYDLYADRMAASRPRDAQQVELAAQPTRPGEPKQGAAPESKEESAPGPAEKVARAEPSRPRQGLATDRAIRRTNDTAIRVTLGRPESLPTLNEPGAAAAPTVAAASNWQRPEVRAADRSFNPDYRAPGTARQERPGERDDRGEPATRPARDERPATNLAAAGSARREGAPTEPPGEVSSDARLQTILAAARARLESMSTYQVSITRVERVGGQLQPEEDAILSIRRNPRAVRLEWPKGPSKGREVIYSAAVNPRIMFVNMANSALPIPRMSIPIDSPMVLRTSRHPITEAGFDTIFDGLEKHGAADAAGIRKDGKLLYKGVQRPTGSDLACHLLERINASGETWQVYLDTKSLMPAVAVAFQPRGGELIERYTYRELKPNPTELASADAFDPDKRWGESKGLLSRLARAAAAPADSNSGRTTTR
jgi:hypothetical protein